MKLREDAGVERSGGGCGEFVRETAYTWANRLLALRCMEARELIDPVILQQEVYGGRSLEHHRLAQRQPELCAGEDDGLFAVLDKVFREQVKLPADAVRSAGMPGVALRPSPRSSRPQGLLRPLEPPNAEHATEIPHPSEEKDEKPGRWGREERPNPFVAPDALGWTYQYWNTEEKNRVFEKVRTIKGAKIAGADIVPATQLYTEDYMVKFLVQRTHQRKLDGDVSRVGTRNLAMDRVTAGSIMSAKPTERPVEKKPVGQRYVS